jgi:histidine triad (HIT) family protein
MADDSDDSSLGKTQKFNLDDIELDQEELDLSDEMDNLDGSENIDLEFSDGTNEVDLLESELGQADQEHLSEDMDLEFGDGTNEVDLLESKLTGADEEAPLETKNTDQHNEMPIPSPDDNSAIDLDMSGTLDSESEAEDESYEVAPDNAADLDLSGEELIEQSQSSIKTGGAASKKLKVKAEVRPLVKPPDQNTGPRKATVEHNPNCNFCKIALRRFKLMTIYEDDQVIAIMDPNPLMKGQVLLCSKAHKSNIADLSSAENAHFFNVAKIISDGLKKSKITEDAVSYFLSESVNEQESLKHVYMSLIPRRQKDGIGLKSSKKSAVSAAELELLGNHLIPFLS